jgi:Zn-dependent M16 (insulinase) family peptidase
MSKTSNSRGTLDPQTILQEWPTGKTISGFTVVKSELIAELELAAILLEHKDTGCKYLHLARNDMDNVFASLFRTIPEVSLD